MNNKSLINVNIVEKSLKKESENVNYLSTNNVEEVRRFHESFEEYKKTPLYNLEELSNFLEVKNILIKDESHRFGLNAFKVLGGAYAIGKYIAEKLNKDINELSFEYLKSEEVKDKIGELTFVTATDGNHGRGVAWAASQLGQNSVVYMPKGSSQIRLENIRKEGAKAEIIDGDYDDAVELSYQKSVENGWVVIQDTAWDGYENIPIWIMQGYSTIMDEVYEQIIEQDIDLPTHVFLQAGVGSYAGSMLGYLVSRFGENRPKTLIIEPNLVPGLYKSSKEGRITSVEQGPTLMAGLACGTPNTISWEIIYNYADAFISCDDCLAANGMRILAAPIKNDPVIKSGESGAVGMGVLSTLLEDENYKEVVDKFEIDKDSVILIISTEGDTDPEKYRDIVWRGDCPSI